METTPLQPTENPSRKRSVQNLGHPSNVTQRSNPKSHYQDARLNISRPTKRYERHYGCDTSCVAALVFLELVVGGNIARCDYLNFYTWLIMIITQRYNFHYSQPARFLPTTFKSGSLSVINLVKHEGKHAKIKRIAVKIHHSTHNNNNGYRPPTHRGKGKHFQFNDQTARPIQFTFQMN